MVIAIFVNRAYHQYARVIFRGLPLFLAVPGHSPITSISTLNFGPFSTKLGGTIRAIKMTQNDNEPGPGRNYRETGVFTFGREVFFWPKIILENGTFFFVQFFPVVARTWLELKSVFLGQKSWFLA